MSAKKRALIVSDGARSTGVLAEKIAAALPAHEVTLRAAADFSGTDLLPADICFFGCEKPHPPSFAYLEELLAHINLAGRSCGIFTVSPEAAGYLRGLVHDSELALHPEPLLEASGLGAWVSWFTEQR